MNILARTQNQRYIFVMASFSQLNAQTSYFYQLKG